MNDQVQPGDEVLVERRGHTMLITINRPEARNACNQAVWIGVGDALEEAERDDDIRAIVITGAGDKSFSAGADLKAIARGEQIVPDGKYAEWSFAGFANHPVKKPTIAAVNGTALGGGMELVLAADLVVASETAVFGLTEAKVGLVAAAGGAFRLSQRIAPVVAMEMLLTGTPIDAERALALNLINRVVPQAEVVEAAIALAEQIGENAPLSVQAHKRLALGYTVDGERPADAAGWAATEVLMREVSASDDAKEGPQAFAEKRKPNWSGR